MLSLYNKGHPVYVLIAVLLLYTKCYVTGTSITVAYDTARFANNEYSITIPRVDTLVIQSSLYKIGSDSFSSTLCQEATPGGSSICTIVLNSSLAEFQVQLEQSPGTQTRSLYVSVDSSYEAGCSVYLQPIRLIVDTTQNFTCDPVFLNKTLNNNIVSSVQWARSLDKEGNSPSPVISDTTTVTITSNVTTRDDVVGYYRPIFTLDDGTVVSNTLPILVAYEPRLLTAQQEFSDELWFNPAYTQSFTYSCNTQSWPPANIVWRFTSTYPDQIISPNVTVPNNTVNYFSNGSRLIITDSISEVGNFTSINGTITIVNVTYEDAGIFTCFAENDAFKVELSMPGDLAISIRLRVKDHLRPLWPAIGILGVALLVTVFIIFGTMFDNWWARRQNEAVDQANKQRLFSVTSSGSGSPEASNNEMKLSAHSAVRRISSAKVQLLEESSNI